MSVVSSKRVKIYQNEMCYRQYRAIMVLCYVVKGRANLGHGQNRWILSIPVVVII